MELNLLDSDRNSATPFENLTAFLQSFISDIRVKEQHGDQITYLLVDDVKHTKIFPRMLAALDENKGKYHIKSYGLSNSSIEQVFLRVADEAKRLEDYKRISCWKRMKARSKRWFGQDENTDEQNNNERTEEESVDDQESFDTGFSGMDNNRIGFILRKLKFPMSKFCPRRYLLYRVFRQNQIFLQLSL